MDPIFCNALVDFNVPGKPNPPPSKLTATVWTQSRSLATGTLEKNLIEFTDASGKVVWPIVPLNTWVVPADNAVERSESGKAQKSCIEESPLVFIDMHDGDKKLVTLSGNHLTIDPVASDERLSTSLCDPQSLRLFSYLFRTEKCIFEKIFSLTFHIACNVYFSASAFKH